MFNKWLKNNKDTGTVCLDDNRCPDSTTCVNGGCVTATSGIANVANDDSPQLGGDLSASWVDISTITTSSGTTGISTSPSGITWSIGTRTGAISMHDFLQTSDGLTITYDPATKKLAISGGKKGKSVDLNDMFNPKTTVKVPKKEQKKLTIDECLKVLEDCERF